MTEVHDRDARDSSTVDGIHGTRGDEPVRWSLSHPGELPPDWIGSRYNQDENDPNLWWPAPPPGPNEIRPARPGDSQPSSYARQGDEEKPFQRGLGEGKLDVNPADLTNASEQYAELQAAAAAIGPQAVDEVNRIIASNGPMGYLSVTVGVVAGLARRQAVLEKKAADFDVYSTLFAAHAAAYQTGDSNGARASNRCRSATPTTGSTTTTCSPSRRPRRCRGRPERRPRGPIESDLGEP